MFVDEVMRLHPERPCVLVGACSGAIVAFELARQLAAAGRPVSRIIMLDPSTVVFRQSRLAMLPVWRRLVVPRFIGKRLALYMRDLRRLEGSARREFIREKRRKLGRLLRHRNLFLESARELNRTRVREATVAALHRYSPRAYDGAVTLVIGERFRSHARAKTLALWRDVCTGSLEIHTVPATTSGQMLRPPILGELVRLLQDLL
jgi:thioesterase domain-containing protein